MTSEQLNQLQKLFEELKNISEDILSDFDNDYLLKMVDSKESVLIQGNSEGLINLATAILEIALSRKEGQHKHFGTGALDDCEKELEILYKNAELE